MRNKLTIAASLVIIATLGVATPAQAQFGDLKKAAKKEMAKKAKKEIEKQFQSAPAPSSTPAATTHSAASHSSASLGHPAANLTALTKCATLKPGNIIIGNRDDYTFSQGMSSERRTGLINRRAASFSGGCILPSLQPNEFVYMEVDYSQYRAMGGASQFEMQCVKSANPSAGAVGAKEGLSEYPSNVKYLKGKDMMLHCGNSEGVTDCATGSNGNRSSAWKKKLDAKGKIMLSTYARPSTLAPAGGEKLYCQYYNKTSGTSLFAFEYLRTRN